MRNGLSLRACVYDIPTDGSGALVRSRSGFYAIVQGHPTIGLIHNN